MSADVITINFCGDVLYAVGRPAGVVVAIKPICQALGLAWTKQLQRIKRDSIMVEGMTMMVIPSVGGAQETICLRIDLINGWLFGIDETRVKDDAIRQRVRDYKRNCYRVLFEHFQARLDCEPAADTVPGHGQRSMLRPAGQRPRSAPRPSSSTPAGCSTGSVPRNGCGTRSDCRRSRPVCGRLVAGS